MELVELWPGSRVRLVPVSGQRERTLEREPSAVKHKDQANLQQQLWCFLCLRASFPGHQLQPISCQGRPPPRWGSPGPQTHQVSHCEVFKQLPQKGMIEGDRADIESLSVYPRDAQCVGKYNRCERQSEGYPQSNSKRGDLPPQWGTQTRETAIVLYSHKSNSTTVPTVMSTREVSIWIPDKHTWCRP